ncbi:MAG: SOS response-associated peptidase family protein, partial [Cytophagales bacterium]|nr:SOS response-associated peptidase family protein [Cytophagales bacterium]
MCYHKQNRATLAELKQRYRATAAVEIEEGYQPRYHETGFSFRASPVICADEPNKLVTATWGLIPFWAKTQEDADMIRSRTLNCISEEMFTKPSFRDAVKHGQRCLVPCTGFFEWRHEGKLKYPYFIHAPEGKVFSLGGLYSD